MKLIFGFILVLGISVFAEWHFLDAHDEGKASASWWLMLFVAGLMVLGMIIASIQ